MINHILYVQPIFAPDQRRADRNIASIQTMGEFIKTNGTDGIKLTIVFGGWAINDDLWNQIVSACKKYINESINPVRFDRNYGKALIVNKLIKVAEQTTDNFQAMLTADSDILFPLENKNMFGRLAFAATQLESQKQKPFGMVALNQKGEACHYASCQENNIEYIINTGSGSINEKIVWPTNPSGIAGGCIFLSKKMWDIVGGYRVMGVYSGDDAWLLVDCFSKGFSHQMFDSLSIIHPPENDAEYSAWKVKVCQRDSMTGPKSNIDPQIKEADQFWEIHGKK